MIAGTLHFVRREMYEAIVPPYVPRAREAVAVSGAAEIAGGLAALSPRLRAFTRWWLTGLLLAVFPANVHMAVNPDQVRGGRRIPRWLLWVRLPVQALLIAWVWRGTRASS
ncbi:MAG: DoxX family protein [Thermoleophilaceae bacterium]